MPPGNVARAAAGDGAGAAGPRAAGAPAYVGRFAPTPSGPLHAGSLVAALASWLDARSQSGRWLLRLEDLDAPRNAPGAAATIVDQLARCGLHADGEPALQSARVALYQAALDHLVAAGAAYPCGCSRADLRATSGAAVAGGEGDERVYPGTCRHGLGDRSLRSFRLRTDTSPGAAVNGTAPAPAPIEWTDRRLGPQAQDVAREVGDFVLKRADGVWAYQLAVVVDDAAQGITDVVRGEDLADTTARQVLLQHRLGLPTPRYLHVPLVRAADGQKLSKQTGAAPLDLRDPLAELRRAGRVLGIEAGGTTIAGWLAAATAAWHRQTAAAAPPAGIIAR